MGRLSGGGGGGVLGPGGVVGSSSAVSRAAKPRTVGSKGRRYDVGLKIWEDLRRAANEGATLGCGSEIGRGKNKEQRQCHFR